MTPKTLTTIVLAGAVLTLGAPAALAGTAPDPTTLARASFASGTAPDPMAEDGFDRAVATSLALAVAEDAKLALQSSSQSMFRRAFDPDLFRVDAVSAAAPISVTDSSPRIAWLQIGIGFGIGILLTLGLWLAVRLTRTRSLAHG